MNLNGASSDCGLGGFVAPGGNEGARNDILAWAAEALEGVTEVLYADREIREAEITAREYGSTQDHRGWICNAVGGHRGDRKTTGDTE